MIIIRNGTVVSPEGSRTADILIDGEKISAVGERLQADGAEEIDASGKLIFPGFIDAHTHFDLHVAGTATIDGFASGTKAAVAGGTTTIIDFGTAYPGETLKEGIENWHKKAAEGCSSDYGFHQTITEWNPEISAECRDMMDMGITTFKIYMTYDTQLDDRTILKVLKRLKEVGGITGCHCENAGLIDALRDEYASDGRVSEVRSHYLTRPAYAEAEAIGRLCRLAQTADTPVIDVHLTCREGLEEIRAARRRGQTVFAETCPQYLVMDDSLYELPGFEGAKYVCAPPLRKKEDREALWRAIADGEIQTVSTDHCSFTTEQKALGKDDFRRIPGGVNLVELRARILYSEGVAKGRITKEKLCEVCAENPAKLYGLYPRKGVIRAGSDADLVILDPAKSAVVTAEDQVSKSDYSCLEGQSLTGVIEAVYLRGEKTAAFGKVLKEGRGVFLKRDRFTAPPVPDMRRPLVVVRGGGDLATGSIMALKKAGYPVLVLEAEHPSAIRRTVAFSEAVYEGRSEVEGMECVLASGVREAERLLLEGKLVMLKDPDAEALSYFTPRRSAGKNGRGTAEGNDASRVFETEILVDAVIAKKNLGTSIDMAPLVIALGPGFTAGEDCDAVIETKRGHRLGRIITEGSAAPNSGIPGMIAGHAADRVIHAECAGTLHDISAIGDIVREGQPIARIVDGNGEEHEVKAPFTGLLRGLIRDGYPVTKGFKIADVDPRESEHDNCFTVSDKARAIGGGVLLCCAAHMNALKR